MATKLILQLAIEGVLVLLLCSWGLNLLKDWFHYTNEDRQHGLRRRYQPAAWNSQVYLEPEQENRYPIVLWWLPYSETPRIVKPCKLGTCLFTHSRTEINNSLTKDVIFYGTGLQWDDMPLPRNPSQTWSLLHEESPINAWSLTTPEVMSLFNHTATCSRFSSFPLTTLSLDSLEPLLSPLKTPSYRKSIEGLGLVMYLQSDCHTPSDRDSYVSELMQYIPVDSYGQCLRSADLPDPPGNIDEIMLLMSKYKFVLAFEDAICDDYITEELWRIFEAGSVPVYKGSPSVKDWMPNDHSVIIVDEFSSPGHLAHYLLLLHEDMEEYNTYFDYKTEGITNERLLKHMKEREWTPDDPTNEIPNFVQGFECHVCDSIHKRQQEEEEGGKVLKPTFADKTHYRCPSLKPSLQLTSRSDLGDYHGRGYMNSWKEFTVCEEMKGKSVARAINEGAGKEKVKEVLEEVSEKCRHLDISEVEWMLNQHNLKILHTPVSIGMCKNLN